jgi:hypothetical protein
LTFAASSKEFGLLPALGAAVVAAMGLFATGAAACYLLICVAGLLVR